MRATGALLIAIAVLVLAATALWPREIDLGLGTTANCGPSVLRLLAQEEADNEFAQAAVDRCERQAFWTLTTGAVIFVVGLTAGLAMISDANQQELRHQRELQLAYQATPPGPPGSPPHPPPQASRLPAPPSRPVADEGR